MATPTERRNFINGKICGTHGEYPVAIRTLAERECLPLIDLTKSTTELYNVMGDSLSKRLFVHFLANFIQDKTKNLRMIHTAMLWSV